MTGPRDTDGGRIDSVRRAAAVASVTLAGLALVVAVVGALGDLGRALAVPTLLVGVVVAAWIAATQRALIRTAAAAGVLVALFLVVVVVLRSDGHGLLLVVLAMLVVSSSALARFALGRDLQTLKDAPVPGTPVGASAHGVLIMNLKSGGGKAERFDLAQECTKRGIEAIVLQPDDDLLQLARDAIDSGADVIGMAGGDGSQALVASVAMAVDVPFVCVPAGTRNHFALDLGLDRDDVVGALDAFDAAVERRIDLAEVNDRVFVNNVSLGVYAKIVQSPEYRDAKRQTTATMLPELLGPDAAPFDLHFTGPDGLPQDGAQIIQVSNNPYVLTSLGGFGTRARMDTGELGIAAAEVHSAANIAAFVAAEAAGHLDRYKGWTGWSSPTFTLESSQPVAAGVDGEALLLDPPLVFRTLPGAVRIRLPHHAPGYSPAALKAPSPWWTLRALARAAAGHATPLGDASD